MWLPGIEQRGLDRFSIRTKAYKSLIEANETSCSIMTLADRRSGVVQFSALIG